MQHRKAKHRPSLLQSVASNGHSSNKGACFTEVVIIISIILGKDYDIVTYQVTYQVRPHLIWNQIRCGLNTEYQISADNVFPHGRLAYSSFLQPLEVVNLMLDMTGIWCINGRDSRSKGCEFDSRPGHH